MDTGSLVWTKEKLKPYTSNQDSKLVNVTGFLNNSSGNISHMSLSSLAIQKMWNVLSKIPGFSFSNSLFLDFGSGSGLIVLAALTHPFSQVIGVELDKTSATIAEKNIVSFIKKKSNLIQCNDFQILNQDMSTIEFSSIGCMKSELPTIILYMYEPLWTLAKEDAFLIYRRIMRKAKASGRKIIVIYFFAGVYSGDALPVFEELGSTLLFKDAYCSLFFGPPEDLYVYEL
jgi:hypothetical protein